MIFGTQQPIEEVITSVTPQRVALGWTVEERSYQTARLFIRGNHKRAVIEYFGDLSSAPVLALDYSDDGRQLTVIYSATYDHFGEVLRLESKTGRTVHKLNTIWIHPEETARSPTGNILATVQERPEIV